MVVRVGDVARTLRAVAECYFLMIPLHLCFNDTASTEIYPLSLHDALPIFDRTGYLAELQASTDPQDEGRVDNLNELISVAAEDRKSTRLNSSHANISYAVFCLKKKNRFTYEKEQRPSSTPMASPPSRRRLR